MVKICYCPSKNNCFSFVLLPPPPAGTSQRVQAGLGLRPGVQGQGQAELGLGGQGVLGKVS
jgi:hypothetical protein